MTKKPYKTIARLCILLSEMNEIGMVEAIEEEMEWTPYEVISIETDVWWRETSFTVWIGIFS